MLVAQGCLTLCDPMDCSLPGSSVHEYWSGLPRSPPGDLPEPGLNPDLPHGRQILYHLSHQGSPLKWMGDTGLKSRWQEDCIPFGGSGEESISLPVAASRSFLHFPTSHGRFVHLHSYSGWSCLRASASLWPTFFHHISLSNSLLLPLSSSSKNFVITLDHPNNLG